MNPNLIKKRRRGWGFLAEERVRFQIMNMCIENALLKSVVFTLDCVLFAVPGTNKSQFLEWSPGTCVF